MYLIPEEYLPDVTTQAVTENILKDILDRDYAGRYNEFETWTDCLKYQLYKELNKREAAAS